VLIGVIVLLGLALAGFLFLRNQQGATPAGQTTSPSSVAAPVGGAAAGGSPALRLTIVRPAGVLEKGVLIINSSAATVPLGPLSFGSDKFSTSGEVWGISELPPNSCLLGITGKKEKDDDDDKQISLASFASTCTTLAAEPLLDDKDEFWKDTFAVSYNNQTLGTCPKEQEICTIDVIP